MIEIAIVILLLALGYSFGSYRERKHYASIRAREAALADILVFESRFPAALNPSLKQTVSPKESLTGGQMVLGSVVVSVDYFKMFVANLRKLVGGRLGSYESLLDRGRREAILRMKEHAKQLNANRVFNVRLETASVSKGDNGNLGSIEVLAYGSALLAEPTHHAG